MTTDVLAQGGERRRPDLRASATALALLLTGGVLTDAWAGRREKDALVRCRAAAQEQAAYATRQVSGLRSYVGPALSSPERGVRESVTAVLDAAVREQVASLRTERDRCSSVSVLPWHRSVAVRREAAVASVEVLIGQVQALSP